VDVAAEVVERAEAVVAERVPVVALVVAVAEVRAAAWRAREATLHRSAGPAAVVDSVVAEPRVVLGQAAADSAAARRVVRVPAAELEDLAAAELPVARVRVLVELADLAVAVLRAVRAQALVERVTDLARAERQREIDLVRAERQREIDLARAGPQREIDLVRARRANALAAAERRWAIGPTSETTISTTATSTTSAPTTSM
jgi:hypothetical protein